MIDRKHQLILLEMLWNYAVGINRVKKKNVLKYFCNDKDFYKHMNDLERFGYVKGEGNGTYCFRMNGYAIANIIALHFNTNIRFRKVAKEIRWLP